MSKEEEKSSTGGMELFEKITFWLFVAILVIGIGATIFRTVNTALIFERDYEIQNQNPGFGSVNLLVIIFDVITIALMIIVGFVLTAITCAIVWVPYWIAKTFQLSAKRSEESKEEIIKENKKRTCYFVISYFLTLILWNIVSIWGNYKYTKSKILIPMSTNFTEFLIKYVNIYKTVVINSTIVITIILLIALFMTWLPYFIKKIKKQDKQ